ncbi:hypothetical protein Mapa_001645 [Marchantia paleacea]|nr:hypothetical protein Mapa_001645 [Marchantia paleacea]
MGLRATKFGSPSGQTRHRRAARGGQWLHTEHRETLSGYLVSFKSCAPFAAFESVQTDNYGETYLRFMMVNHAMYIYDGRFVSIFPIRANSISSLCWSEDDIGSFMFRLVRYPIFRHVDAFENHVHVVKSRVHKTMY